MHLESVSSTMWGFFVGGGVLLVVFFFSSSPTEKWEMLLQISIVWKDSPIYGGSKDKKPDCNQFNWKQADLFLRLLCGKCVFMCLR